MSTIMSRGLNEEIVSLLKNLIHQISGYEEGTKQFSVLEKQITSQLKKADTMSFVNQKDIDNAISSMGQKFMFHGFFTHASRLEKAYHKYIIKDVPKSELMNRLNVVKFLLHMSESPTNHFWKNPEEFIHKEEEHEEIINWGEFLNEGIKIWYPESGDDSSWSEDSDMSIGELESSDVVDANESKPPVIVDNTSTEVIIDFRANREELLNTIQHTWYNSDKFVMHPPSDWDDANIGIIWEDYLKDQVKGLISIESSSVISEYKVIREVLWQLFYPHASTVFQLKENAVQPKPNVTISSVRQMPFMSFMNEFIPYIELLDYFRSFETSLWAEDECAKPETYKSYFKSIKNILEPVYLKIVQIEDRVKEQESTMTLLKLASELKKLFEPLEVLKQIHDNVTQKYLHESRLTSAIDLLYKLHQSLKYSYSKTEHDIKLTLYLESLYYYFKLIDCWLMKNDFFDYTDEFVIKRTEDNAEPWKMNFAAKDDIDVQYMNDDILKIFTEDVLEIGRNLQLLRQLGKYNLTSEHLVLEAFQMETLHDDFIHRILKELCKYYENTEINNPLINKGGGSNGFPPLMEKEYKSPVICTDACKKITDMDKLENTVDTGDGFLMEAFKTYFVKVPKVDVPIKEETLFEKISRMTKSLFPTQNFLQKALADILKERFTVSGLMVKNLLIEEYKLDKQFEFLRHVFLFADDLIFSFYRRFFEKVNSSNKNWGNKIWLTSHLQDIIMDLYPNFYEKCTVEIKDYWKNCMDFLSSLQLVNIQYKIEWPLNIIIVPQQMQLYQEVFQLLLKLKWSLYTVNHLTFKVIEPNRLRKLQSKVYKTTVTRLKYLRFSLLNILNNIQHYIFGYIYNKCLNRFELNFEKSSDLKTLMVAHSDFIHSLHKAIINVLGTNDSQTGFCSIIRSVKLLNNLWNDIAIASNEKLADCYAHYKAGFKIIDPVVNPVYIFDY